MSNGSHTAKVYKGSDNDWWYTVVAGNGEVVDKSEEGFESKSYCVDRLEQQWPDAALVFLPSDG